MGSVVWHDGSDACYTVHSCEMCLYIYLVLGIWIFTALITHHFLVQNKKNTILKDVQKKLSNVLFLIAHPDDECMFFGPAITSLTRQTDSSSSKKKAAKNIYILCLSDGNAEGLGKIRREEFFKSCRLLGFHESNVFIHEEEPHFTDSQTLGWNPQTVANTLYFYIQKLKINNLITFDDYGVSGHLNHQSLYNGVQYLQNDQTKKLAVRYLALESISLIRKYWGFIDSLFSFNHFICTADWSTRKQIQKAMEAHASQYVWFRRIYVTFSRYLFINTFRLIEGKKS